MEICSVRHTHSTALPLVFSSCNEKEAYVKNRHEELRLMKILEQLSVQEKVYLQVFRKEKQVVEGNSGRFFNRLKSLSLGHAESPSHESHHRQERRKTFVSSSEEIYSTSVANRPERDTHHAARCFPRSNSMPNTLNLWRGGVAATDGPVISKAGSKGRKSKITVKRAMSLSAKIESKMILSQRNNSCKRLIGVLPRVYPSVRDKKLLLPPPTDDASEIRKLTENSYRKTSTMVADEDPTNEASNTTNAIRYRPNSATNSSRRNATCRRNSGVKPLRSLSAHDITTATDPYEISDVTTDSYEITKETDSYPHAKKVSIFAGPGSDDGKPDEDETNRRRCSSIQRKMRDSKTKTTTMRSNSVFSVGDSQMALREELRELEEKRIRRKSFKIFRIDEAIVVEQVRYRKCLQKLDDFITKFNDVNRD